MVELKRLGIQHADAIVAFDLICFPTDYWNQSQWTELLEDEKSIYYALLDNDHIIGNIFIYNWKGERNYIKIMNIAIHKDYRGRGLAQKLLNHVTTEMSRLEMKRFCGETRASNKTMQHVFEACGYQLNSIEPHYYDDPDESAYKYVLDLLVS